MSHERRSPLLTIVLAALAVACAREPRSDSRDTALAPAPTALMDAPDQSFTRGAVTINYRTLGTGAPVLLVHGYGDNLAMWVGLADSLARDHRVFAIDTRGFGKSSKPGDVTNYGKEMITDLVAFLDHVGVQQAHVIGYSMGAVLGATLALEHPERVRTLTLAAGAFPRDSAAMRAMVTPWINDLEHGRRLTGLIKQVVPVLPDSTARTFSDQLFAEGDSAALVAALKGFPALSIDWTRAAGSKIPTVAIVGLNDPLRPHSQDLAARWPGAKLVELPETDHMTLFTAPRLLEEVRLLTSTHSIDATQGR